MSAQQSQATSDLEDLVQIVDQRGIGSRAWNLRSKCGTKCSTRRHVCVRVQQEALEHGDKLLKNALGPAEWEGVKAARRQLKRAAEYGVEIEGPIFVLLHAPIVRYSVAGSTGDYEIEAVHERLQWERDAPKRAEAAAKKRAKNIENLGVPEPIWPKPYDRWRRIEDDEIYLVVGWSEDKRIWCVRLKDIQDGTTWAQTDEMLVDLYEFISQYRVVERNGKPFNPYAEWEHDSSESEGEASSCDQD